MADVVSGINNKIAGAFTSIGFLNVLGWIVAIILMVGVGLGIWLYYRGKKEYNKIIEVHEIVGNQWVRTFTDTAKNIKIGAGGYIVLYLKKLKTWKIAYGGKSGRNTYAFYIMPDGYWYNAVQYANLQAIDDFGGMIPVVTTNASMRAQYTSLEKQIDTLHQDKKSFFDKYGGFILSVAFILISGFMLYFIAKQIGTIAASNAAVTDKVGTLIDRVSNLLANFNPSQGGNSGLVPVK